MCLGLSLRTGGGGLDYMITGGDSAGEVFSEYSGTSEKGTLWDQYKFKWFVPFIEVVLF